MRGVWASLLRRTVTIRSALHYTSNTKRNISHNTFSLPFLTRDHGLRAFPVPYGGPGSSVRFMGTETSDVNIAKWSVDEVVSWLNVNGFQDIAVNFEEHSIDGEELLELSESELSELCPAIGHRKKLARSLARLKPTTADPSASAASPTPSTPQQPHFPDISASSDMLSRSRLNDDIGTEVERPKAVTVRVTSRSRKPGYALPQRDITPALQSEIDAFHTFLTVKFFGQQEPRIGQVTAKKYIDHVKALLGWVVKERDIPADELSFADVFPDSSRESVKLSFEYMQWLVNERGINPRTEGVVVRSLTQLAKFLFHSESNADPSEGDKPYHDILLVRELRKMSNDANERSKTAPSVSKDELKWLSWPDYLRCVEQLREECIATRDGEGSSPVDTAHAFQVYLICAILSCIPDRQRTLRELEVGRTLVQSDGLWVIKHGPGDYKTGGQYGDRPPLVISPKIYPLLEEYLSTWRQHFQPDHDFVFSTKKGRAPSASFIHRVFTTNIYRLSGQKTNPHMIRDMIVTYLRQSDASERDLEALAIYMGHSIAMQKSTYDKRSKAQKVAPAVELLSRLQDDLRHQG